MTSSERPDTPGRGIDPRSGRLWATTACLVAAAWIAVSVTESPAGSLFLLVISLSVFGGLLVARPRRVGAVTMVRRFAVGMLGTAAVVLAMVGIAHHVAVGLATAAALAATSPPALRRMRGR